MKREKSFNRGKLDGGGGIFLELERISRFSVGREVEFWQLAVEHDAP